MFPGLLIVTAVTVFSASAMHVVTTLDCHVAGEPLRVVTSGFPEPAGSTILEKRRHCRTHLDHLRTALVWEPRGHHEMYGCLLVAPVHPQADTGVLFFHNEGYSTMCGHGIIGLTTVMLEQGLFPASVPTTTIRFDTPSGLVTAQASIDKGRVRSVAFLNVPSFVLDVEQTIQVPGIGPVDYDLAFGGAFYAFCRAEALGLALEPEHASRLQALGLAIKQAIMAERTISHPVEPELGYLYGTIFVGPSQRGDLRQTCIFANGTLDRSPTGTGVSAHLALLHARGNVGVGQALRFESILGTVFGGTIVEETQLGPYQAIVPEVEGRAWLTGRHEFMIDPDDPLKEGFLLI
ncbi:MAG: proline racemase family protein [Nitrospira sp.]|nr:proline racemase family protein [Nitrospira sp.]